MILSQQFSIYVASVRIKIIRFCLISVIVGNTKHKRQLNNAEHTIQTRKIHILCYSHLLRETDSPFHQCICLNRKKTKTLHTLSHTYSHTQRQQTVQKKKEKKILIIIICQRRFLCWPSFCEVKVCFCIFKPFKFNRKFSMCIQLINKCINNRIK